MVNAVRPGDRDDGPGRVIVRAAAPDSGPRTRLTGSSDLSGARAGGSADAADARDMHGRTRTVRAVVGRVRRLRPDSAAVRSGIRLPISRRLHSSTSKKPLHAAPRPTLLGNAQGCCRPGPSHTPSQPVWPESTKPHSNIQARPAAASDLRDGNRMSSSRTEDPRRGLHGGTAGPTGRAPASQASGETRYRHADEKAGTDRPQPGWDRHSPLPGAPWCSSSAASSP